MKMDKETVVKHQFWFLLGGYLFFWLLAVLWLKFSAPDTIKVAKDSYEKAQKDVKTAQGSAVNKSTFVPPWEKEAAEFEQHKGKIWKHAWDYQADMFDWPKEWFSKYKMLSPQEAISTDDLSNYSRKLYPEQIKSLRADAPHWIEPVELLGGFDAIFKPKTKADWHDTPTREECWLAQEDIWVKRELFVIIWNALARQAVMQSMPLDKKDANTDPSIKASYRFANKIWDITLRIRANDKGTLVIGGDSTIKNIHPSGHPLPLTSAKGKGVWFNVSQNGVRTLFEVRGEPVNNGETRLFSVDKDGKRADYPPLEGINWSKAKEQPILVSLGFDQTNCPIRRLNAIELGQQDCRSFVWSLQPNHPLAELDASPEDANKAQESAASSSSSMSGGGGGMSQEQMKNQQDAMRKQMMGGMGGRGGGQSAEVGNPTSHNQFERNRYLQPPDIDKKANPPSRHLPLAIQLITEQSHMHDVLLALANSRLRFQITQVDFRHEKNYVPQTEEEKKDSNKEKTGTGGPGVFMGPTAMPNMSGGMMGGAGGGNMRARMLEQMQRQKQMQSPMGGGGAPNTMMQQQMRQEMMRRSQQGGSGGPGATGGPPMQNPMMMGGAMGPGKGPFLANSPKSRGSNLPQMGAGGPTDTKKAEQNQPDDNLVELTIYGIATLYRAPDPPKAEEQAGQSGTSPPPTAPQVQGTPPAANGTTQPAAETNTTANPDKKATTGAGTTPNPATQQGTATPPNNGAPKPADAKQAEKPADKQPTAPKTVPPPASEKR